LLAPRDEILTNVNLACVWWRIEQESIESAARLPREQAADVLARQKGKPRTVWYRGSPLTIASTLRFGNAAPANRPTY
jgi:hypothetical protein